MFSCAAIQRIAHQAFPGGQIRNAAKRSEAAVNESEWNAPDLSTPPFRCERAVRWMARAVLSWRARRRILQMAWRTKSSTAPAASSPSSPFKERWRKALSAAGLHLESGAAFVLGRPPQAAAKGAVPSGSLAFDLANGCGGWPRGRVSELVGPPGAGKTACALAAVAAV